MISIEKIREKLQTGFNNLNDRADREFIIYSDDNEFKHEYRALGSNDIIRYINGIFEPMQPTIMPIKNLEIQTQSFRVTFALDVEILHKDNNGNYAEVEEIRSILEQYIAQNNAIPYIETETESGKSFEVTPTFGGVTVGLETQMSPVGRMLPMYFDFSCVFVENGVNANNVNFIINGENMFFQDYSVTRLRTAETNMFANSSSQKTLVQANGISINLKMPLLNTPQSESIEDDVWSGSQNQAICVERFRTTATEPYKSYSAYIMILGNNSESGSIGQNIGQTVDFVEGKQEELIYGDNWSEEEFTASEITNLKDTEWFLKPILNLGNEEKTYLVEFISNLDTYIKLKIHIASESINLQYGISEISAITVYDSIEHYFDGVTNNYREIAFTDGNDLTNEDLINWLKENAELQTQNPMEKTINLPSSAKSAVVIFWGDGTFNRVDVSGKNPPTTASHTYTTPKKYTIRYFSY